MKVEKDYFQKEVESAVAELKDNGESSGRITELEKSIKKAASENKNLVKQITSLSVSFNQEEAQYKRLTSGSRLN